MDMLVTLLILAVVVGLIYWAASAIPFPAQLSFLRWLIPLIALLAAILWAVGKLGIV